MVFDMITNAPGVLVSTLQWGLLQNVSAATSDPNAVLSLNPTAHEFKPPRANQWNFGLQHKVWRNIIADVAYVGSKSDDLLRQVQINALPFGATLAPQNQDPTRAPAATLGSSALPNDLLRPYPGLRQHPDVGLQRVLELPRAADVDYSPVRPGLEFLRLLRLEQGRSPSTASDGSAGVPNLSDEETRRLDYSLTDYDRTHNFVDQFHLPGAEAGQRCARHRSERLANLRHLSLDERPACTP